MNDQQFEKKTNDERIEVHSMFDTIQGEGPFVGTPATFIRLAGCNLACPLCDTDYTSSRTKFTPNDILYYVQELGHKPGRLIVITGGEPFRQNIYPLVYILVGAGYKVQIETNGTLYQSGFWNLDGITIVCSPKTPTVHKALRPFIHSYKYVMSADDIGEDGLPTRPLDNISEADRIVARPHEGFAGTIYLQPVDTKSTYNNARHQKAVVDSCMEFGYTLCLQLHKIINME